MQATQHAELQGLRTGDSARAASALGLALTSGNLPICPRGYGLPGFPSGDAFCGNFACSFLKSCFLPGFPTCIPSLSFFPWTQRWHPADRSPHTLTVFSSLLWTSGKQKEKLIESLYRFWSQVVVEILGKMVNIFSTRTFSKKFKI